MAQHDYVIANGSGSSVRGDLNNALAAIVSTNSGTSEPSPTYAYQLWADTTVGVLKMRNGANNAWITLRELDGTLIIEGGSASTPGLFFAGDANTGIYSPGAEQFGIATNGVDRTFWTSTALVINEVGADYDVRIEGDTNVNLFYLDASADRIGFGTNTPAAGFHIALPAASPTIGNIYIAPSTPGQARGHLYNGGAQAEWLFGQKSSTDHSYKISKQVAGSETDYLELTTNGLLRALNGIEGTVIASTAVSASGTSVDFTSIPSWVKRVTVMFNGVSTNGTSTVQVQLGSGSVSTTGYTSVASCGASSGTQYASATTGFILDTSGTVGSSIARSGICTFTLIGSNTWAGSGCTTAGVVVMATAGNSPALSGALDRVRITTVNGSDTFDAGSINILMEG